MNLLKSAVSFKRNIRKGNQILLADLLEVERVDKHEKYIWLPTFVDHNRGACFNHIRERLWKKKTPWVEREMSKCSWERVIGEGGCPSNPTILDVLSSTAKILMR